MVHGPARCEPSFETLARLAINRHFERALSHMEFSIWRKRHKLCSGLNRLGREFEQLFFEQVPHPVLGQVDLGGADLEVLGDF